jgi:hypothetical protein
MNDYNCLKQIKIQSLIRSRHVSVFSYTIMSNQALGMNHRMNTFHGAAVSAA